jgi:hypothetical protein
MKLEDVRIGDVIMYNKGWGKHPIFGVVYRKRILLDRVDNTGFVDVFMKVLDCNGGIKPDTLSARLDSTNIFVIRE